MRVNRLLLAVAVALALPARASAQDVPSPPLLDSGRLVRARLRDGQILRGRLIAPFPGDNSRLVLCLSPGRPCTWQDSVNLRRVSGRSLVGLELYARTRAPEGAVIGAILGIALGYAAHGFAESMCESKGCAGSTIGTVVPSVAIMGILGAVIGTGWSRWQRASLVLPN